MKRIGRLVALCILALLIAPGTWLHTKAPAPDYTAPLEVEALPEAEGYSGKGVLRGVWALSSDNAHFHGFSALVSLGDDRLLAASDRARLMEFSIPDAPGNPARFFFFPGRSDGPRFSVDLEGVTRDPASGTLWASYEQSMLIERLDRQGNLKSAKQPAMADWPGNGGPETILRLPDGRFVVLAEAASGADGTGRAGLIYDRDPLQGGSPAKFTFAPPKGYSPVDAANLPDGKVLILVRRVVFGLPPRFATALVLVDPAELAEGEIWSGEIVARMGGPDLDENFEGIAAVTTQSGATKLYLIADDNQSAFQKTLLLEIDWPIEAAITEQSARSGSAQDQ